MHAIHNTVYLKFSLFAMLGCKSMDGILATFLIVTLTQSTF